MQHNTVVACIVIAIVAIWICVEVYLENKRFWKREEEKQREANRKFWSKDAREYDEFINQN